MPRRGGPVRCRLQLLRHHARALLPEEPGQPAAGHVRKGEQGARMCTRVQHQRSASMAWRSPPPHRCVCPLEGHPPHPSNHATSLTTRSCLACLLAPTEQCAQCGNAKNLLPRMPPACSACSPTTLAAQR